MFSILFVSLLSTYGYEIDRGIYMEPHVGANLLDETDKSSLASGVRVSYSLANQTDSYFAVEGDYTNELIFSNAQDERQFKHLMQAGLSFYEIFNPTAIRFSLGGGVEKRFTKWNPLTYYRMGIGGYFNSNVALFGDATFRQIYRSLRSDTQDLSLPMEVSLSFHWIF